MLDRIGQHDHSDAISQRSGIEKIENKNMSNPYARLDRELLIDESTISDTAIKLYEREQDVRKFSNLALSDPEDSSADARVMEQVFSGEVSIEDDEVLFSILNNQDFLKDIEF